MKLTDFITDIGRPVAYYPGLKKITGSTTATVLLCQFIYWRGKEADKTGWLYKTSDEIEEETGLSYNEQKTARKQLVDAGLLDEHDARLDHQMKFKVNLDAINEKWGTLQPNIPESDDSTLGKDVMPHSLNELKTTTENTTTSLSGIEASILQDRKTTQEDIDAGKDGWTGREAFRPDHYPLVDWYHKVTGQDCPMSKRKDWMKAVSLWSSNALTVADLQAAYDMDISWRGVFTSPNQLTDKAIALKAQKQAQPKEMTRLL